MQTIMHHFQSMDGGYSFALEPYFNEGLTYHLLDDDLIEPLMEIEDLFSMYNTLNFANKRKILYLYIIQDQSVEIHFSVISCITFSGYRRRFTDMPVLQIVATGDEFFLCTDSHYWWDEFPAKKWMM